MHISDVIPIAKITLSPEFRDYVPLILTLIACAVLYGIIRALRRD